MNYKRLAVLGTGHMANATISGLLKKNIYDCITVINAHNPEAAEAFAQKYGIHCGNPCDIADCDVVYLAFKPQGLGDAAPMYSSYTQGKLIVSILAGTDTEALLQAFPGSRVVRAMPNLALSLGMSATAICEGVTAADSDITAAKTLFSALGLVRKVPESLMTRVTALSGSGPAYIYLLAETMIEAAVSDGMDRETAALLCKQTFLGTVKLWKDSSESPNTLRRKITSKGGTTEAGIRAMQDGGFKKSVSEGYLAARIRGDILNSGENHT